MTDKPRGTCRRCSRSILLRRDGLIGFHRTQWTFSQEYNGLVWPQPACGGWRQPPAKDTT